MGKPLPPLAEGDKKTRSWIKWLEDYRYDRESVIVTLACIARNYGSPSLVYAHTLTISVHATIPLPRRALSEQNLVRFRQDQKDRKRMCSSLNSRRKSVAAFSEVSTYVHVHR